VATPAVKVSLRTKLVGALVAVLLAFGVCEVAARIFLPSPPNPNRDPLIKYQRHPELGFFHVPNQQGYLDDGLATINSIGLRGELPEMPRPADSFRIFAIGDSTTFGWGVNDGDTYVVKLERKLRDAYPQLKPRVINGGVGAYDTNREVRLLRYFWDDLKPDLVLLGFLWNDLPFQATTPDGNPNDITEQLKSTYYQVGNVGATFNIGSSPSRWNRILRKSRLLYAARHAWLAMTATSTGAKNELLWETAILEGKSTPAIEKAWDTIKDALTQIRDLTQPAGVPVGIVVMPVPPQVMGDKPNAAYQSRIRAIAEGLGFFVIDPLPTFKEHRKDAKLFIPYDRLHTDSAGQALIADVVFEALKQQPTLRR
jgi:lysophospholipase L1-like esterase